MTWHRIRNILIKEWEVVFSDRNNIFITTALPILIIAEPMVIIWLISRYGGGTFIPSSVIQSALQRLQSDIPLAATLPSGQQFQLLLLSQFKFYLLLIPTMIAVSFSTFSIVDEKQTRSLEPLLATPVRTGELLLGKALAGAIPAIIISWISGGIFLLGVVLMGWGNLISLVLTPSWLIVFFMLTPAVSVLAFLLGVIGSSQAKDARTAQTLVLLIILPVFALIAIQVLGLVWFTPVLTLVLSLGLFVLDYIILQAAVRLFQRESIILKWR